MSLGSCITIYRRSNFKTWITMKSKWMNVFECLSVWLCVWINVMKCMYEEWSYVLSLLKHIDPQKKKSKKLKYRRIEPKNNAEKVSKLFARCMEQSCARYTSTHIGLYNVIPKENNSFIITKKSTWKVISYFLNLSWELACNVSNI